MKEFFLFPINQVNVLHRWHSVYHVHVFDGFDGTTVGQRL